MRDIIESMGWISKSWFCAVGFTLLPLVIVYYGKRFGVRPEVSVFWILIFAAFGILLISRTGGHGIVTSNLREFLIPIRVVIPFAIFGILIMAPTQIFYGQAIHTSINPAYAATIINSSTVWLYFSAWFLYQVRPMFFSQAVISWNGFIGAVIVIIGIAVVVCHRPPQI